MKHPKSQTREPHKGASLGKGKSQSKQGQLFLIDGNSFCYRAFYAIRHLSNSKGEPTNAIYGFVSMIRKLIQEGAPDYVAVCFDRKEPTFRHKMYEDYKATRKPMPDELVQQMEPIKEFCRASRFALFEKAGYEADDLLGTLACRGKEEGLEVFILTGDKDAMQLVDDHIKIMNPHKENEIIDRAKVKKRFDGIGPERVIDLMALMGDSSDNIPGVPGIGEKTALKLIQEFGSIEDLYKDVKRIKSKSQQRLIVENEKIAHLSKELAKIQTEIPLDINWNEIKLTPPDEIRLFEFFKRYEFWGLLKKSAPTTAAKDEKRHYQTLETEKKLKIFVEELQKAEAFSFDTETTGEDPMRAHLVGLSFSLKPFHAAYLPVSSSHHSGPGLPIEKVLKVLKPILESKTQKKYGQNLKYDWIVMKRNGITIQGIAFDTMIASYLVNPIKLNHNLDDIALEYLSLKKISTASLLGSGKNQKTMDQIPLEQVAEYACEDADSVMRLVSILREKLQERNLSKLFEDLELPLSEILAKIEMNGVNLDIQFLKELSKNAGEDLDKLTRDIYREAGEEFNINSTKQLAEILFTKLKLPVIKRTKTGYSTDVSVLEKLSLNHELPRKMLEYRERAKLKSTYLDALPVTPKTFFPN